LRGLVSMSAYDPKRTLPDLGSLELDNNNNSMFLGLWNKMRLWPHLTLSVKKAVFEFSAC